LTNARKCDKMLALKVKKGLTETKDDDIYSVETKNDDIYRQMKRRSQHWFRTLGEMLSAKSVYINDRPEGFGS